MQEAISDEDTLKLSSVQAPSANTVVTIYLFVILVPEGGIVPLASLGRFMLEIFPAFVILAAIGQKRNFNLYYLSICLPCMTFLLLQWVTGGWVV